MNFVRICFTSLLLGASLSPATEWLQFRGTDGKGIAEKTVKKWTDKNLAWKIPVAIKGWSSPVVSKGKLILTGSLEKGGKTHLMIKALDVKTGKEIWETSLFTPSEKE